MNALLFWSLFIPLTLLVMVTLAGLLRALELAFPAFSRFLDRTVGPER